MKRKDFFLAILIVIVWGANFTATRLGLDGVPPMLLVAIRYTLVAFPAIFFIKKPDISWRYIVYYGLTVGCGQFSALYFAMEIGMPAGLASVILQLQAFISPLLARIIFKESIKLKQVIGFSVGGLGLFVISLASTNQGLGSIPLPAILLTVLAPFFWSISNIVSKLASNKAKETGVEFNMINMIVWSALVPPIPMTIFALFLDKPSVLINSILGLKSISLFSFFYLAYLSTIFGYGAWGVLISKYPISKITPISLLVPVTGLSTASIVLGEKLTPMQWLGTFIILFGLFIANVDIKGSKQSA